MAFSLNPFKTLSDFVAQGTQKGVQLLTKGKVPVPKPKTLTDIVKPAVTTRVNELGITGLLKAPYEHDLTRGMYMQGQAMKGTPIKTADQQYQNLVDTGEAKPYIASVDPTLIGSTKNIVKGIAGKADDLAKSGGKVRKFIDTVKESPKTKPQVAKEIKGTYAPISNKQTLDRALKFIDADEQAALRSVLNSPKPTSDTYATAQALINKFQNSGRYEEAINVVEDVARKATEQGQAIQALSMYNRLTPEGALRFAQRNAAKTGKPLLPEQAKAVTEQAKLLKTLKEGRPKQIGAAKLKQLIEPQSTSRLQKLSTLQTGAQLLNPKTAIRNVVGNAGFQVAENISDTLGTPLDKLVSKFTGKRTKFLPSPTTQLKGFFRGAKEGIQDVRAGVNTLPNVTSQFDLPAQPTATSKVGKFFEKALGYELRVPDRAFYQAAYDDALRMQMKAAKVVAPTPEMMEMADFVGKYRTFQDPSKLSKGFSWVKKGLNAGQDFGLGDFVLKYPKTPANLLARGIDYSPAGALKSIVEIVKGVTGKGFNQTNFVNALSRSVVGSTGMVGLGYYLHKIGALTPGRPDNKKVAQLEEETGLGPYRLNVSALKRFVASGFDTSSAGLKPGDTLVSYDWFQPAAINFAMGANLAEQGESKSLKDSAKGFSGAIAGSIEEGSRTLAEQPLLRGLQQLSGYGDIVGGIKEVSKGVASSFIPTLLNQARQLTDNTRRQTYDPNYLKESLNRVTNRIPGLSKKLTPQIGTFGEERENYQGGTNNALNVLLNPAFVSKYNPTPQQRMALNLFGVSGEAEHIPTQANKTEAGATLNASDMANINYILGTRSGDAYSRAMSSPGFMQQPPRKQIDVLKKRVGEAKDYAKEETLGNRMSDVSETILSDISGMSSIQAERYIQELYDAGRIDKKTAKNARRSLVRSF